MTNIDSARTRRNLAAAFAVCGIATIALAVNHPSGGAHGFQELLKEEASNQFIAKLVHGGFVGILGALVVCFVLLGRELGVQSVRAVVGVTAFSIGASMLMASMIVDGLVIPAIAVRYANESDAGQIASARTLFIFGGTLIGFLLPIGLSFQAAATAAFASVFVMRSGRSRFVGWLGLIIGALTVLALLVAPPPMAGHVVMLAIALQVAWNFAVALAIWPER